MSSFKYLWRGLLLAAILIGAADASYTGTGPLTTAGSVYNSTASITRPANTTAYTALTGWNNGTPTYFSFTTACSGAAKTVLIPEIDIWSSANPTLKLTGWIWLFNAIPGTLVSDDTNFNIAAADFANLTGGSSNGVPFTLQSAQGSGAANSGTSLTGLNAMATCASGVATIYGMVEVGNAYVPASAEILTITLRNIGQN